MDTVINPKTWAALCAKYTVWVMHALRQELDIRMGDKIVYVSEINFYESRVEANSHKEITKESLISWNQSFTISSRSGLYGGYVPTARVEWPIYLGDYKFMKNGKKRSIRCAVSRRNNALYIYKRKGITAE